MIAGPRGAVVLQARMNSARLPGKALALASGRSLLAHCIERMRLAGVGPVIVATTERSEDDAIVGEALRCGALPVRGPDEDVLGRFLLAADRYALDWIVRATADNPAVDIGTARRVLRGFDEAGADHAIEVGLPYGSAVEAVSVAALREAAAAATDPADREHVTPFIRRDRDRFRVVELVAPIGLRRPDLRLTVDTRADLEFMRRVLVDASQGRAEPATLARIIAAADNARGEAA